MTRGDLVVVQRGSHSWLLKDPETLPGIMLTSSRPAGQRRLEGPCRRRRGIDPVDATDDEVERRPLRARRPGARAHPRQRHHDTEGLHRPPASLEGSRSRLPVQGD